MSIDREKPVAAVSSNEKLEGDSSLYQRYHPLARALSTRGMNVIALHGRNDLSEGTTHSFDRYFTFTPEGLVAQDAQIHVDAARDLTGGIARYTGVAALNPEGMRDVTASKRVQYEVLRASGVGMMPESYFVDPHDDSAVADALAAIHGPRAVFKPEKSQRSRNVIIGSKKELHERLVEYRANNKASDGLLVVQEHIPTMRDPFDSSLRYEVDEQAKVSPDGVNELRVHVIDDAPVLFHGKASVPGREVQSGHNEYVYFDQQYWPEGMHDASIEAARALRSHTGDKDSYVVVDFSPDGRKIVEVNGKNPYAIQPESKASMPVHRVWVDTLSSKLAAMAEREFALRGAR